MHAADLLAKCGVDFNILTVVNRQTAARIEDIYEDTYIVSCDDPDGLIAFVSEARDRKRAEILRHTAGQIAK